MELSKEISQELWITTDASLRMMEINSEWLNNAFVDPILILQFYDRDGEEVIQQKVKA